MNLLPTFSPKKRIQKRIRQYIEEHRSTRGGKIVTEDLGTFSAISLLSRVWLFLVAGGLFTIIYFVLMSWLAWLICLPLGLFCLYQSLFGLRINLQEHVGNNDVELNQQSIDKTVDEASISIELSIGVVSSIVMTATMITLAMIEVLAAVLGAFAAGFAGA